MKLLAATLLFSAGLAAPQRGGFQRRTNRPVNSAMCNGQSYSYLGLAGYGLTPSNSKDKFGDTAGGIGSSATIDPKSWKRSEDGTYTGTLWAMGDRGWNTEGVLNHQPRVHQFLVTLNTTASGGAPNLKLDYKDTVKFIDPAGNPVTGLDPDFKGPYLTFNGFPEGGLPSATFTGDGFGGSGPGGRLVSIDSEGLVLNADGSFYVSDEYGDFIYHFSADGKMLKAVRPPGAYIPKRNDSDSFSAGSPPRFDPKRVVVPENNPTGRRNNQGFEGLTASPDGKFLYALTQSALSQDGGAEGASTRRFARLLQYNVPEFSIKAEYVVPLPLYKNNSQVAAQSEIHYISPTQFLVLSRDGGAGHGQDESLSVYRQVDVFDISSASNINSRFSIAPKGVLNADVQPATYCSWLDYNVNTELGKFNLHNGGAQDAGLLNEKWESLAVVPVLEKGKEDEYFLFSLSDNDFITQDGFSKGGQFKYADKSGFNLDNQVLVFRVKLPQGVKPLVG